MPKRILLADDSITIQKVVELTFSDGDYEVTAVNNGARAIQKLGEMRPDIILSDIIMPEKNGYEVCEYVKSHPEYRNIPVVLLTGTFEPFDPDRAEKAGCDAVVTKPFESQSLIHKVEELIAGASATPASTTAALAEPEPVAEPEFVPPPEPPPSPWMDDVPDEPELSPSPFTTSGGSFPTPPEAYTHSSDIFGAPPAPEATTEMPFEAPPSDVPFAGETRAFPRMSFDELAQTPPPPPPAPEPSPWDEQDLGGETRAFGKMSFDDLQSMQQPLRPEEPSFADPFGAPPEPEAFSSETRAIPSINFDELQQMANTTPEPSLPAPEPEPEPEPLPAAPEPSPWDEQPEEGPLFGGAGETRAFPQVSFADFQQPAPAPEPEPQAEVSPWDEQPAFAGETRAFEKMSFDDLQSMQPVPEPEPEPLPEPLAESVAEAAPWEAPEEPAWSLPDTEPEPIDEPQEPESFATAAVSPVAVPEDMPFATEVEDEPEPEAAAPVEAEEPAWGAMSAAQAVAEPEEPPVPPPALAPEPPPMPVRSSDLTDEQIDRIARRVVELMSDQVVRNIAWEVIPDLAEMVVKERIRQLESEA
ncbi:MAG TPA: response regulator [Thermoanaerobaculia bacterium]|nr:response regulator [Thermoanaerobaculia bacterium]